MASDSSVDPTKSEGRLRDLLSDRYSIERELGRGGMGRVYLARDLKHGRQVAIKVLSPELATGIGAERFLREIRTTARLSHPHIVALHDSGGAEGVPYYIMPHVEGESLRDSLRRRVRLPVAEAIRLAREVAAALAYAHAHGVVHRDIKPDNILLAGGRHACVADFGLARALALATDMRLTGLGTALGSPLYMSPEQAGGESDVDARSDIYGLGCVLFEMLAGEPPFRSDDVRVLLSQHLTSPPPRLRNRRADVSPALEEIVLRCLEKGPDRRFQSADELEAALGALDSGTSLPAAELDGASRARRRPGKGIIIAGVSSVVVLLAVGVLWGSDLAGPFWPFSSEPLDDNRYAVLPFRADADVPDDVQADLRLWDELSKWDGIVTVDRLQLGDVLARADGTIDQSRAAEIGRAVRAGRIVRGEVRTIGDSIRVTAVLHRLGGLGAEVGRGSASFARDGTSRDSAFVSLAQQLLFATAAGTSTAGPGTRSVAAQEAYFAGRRALEAWDFVVAESLLEQAARNDPGYASAHVWLAQVRLWRGMPVDEWSLHAVRASGRVGELGTREAELARALVSMAEGNFPQACERYRSLLRRDERDFAAWFGLAECHSRDPLVVEDEGSPSGFAFRGSYHQAVQAYERAFTSLPSSFHGFSEGSYSRVRDLLYTRTEAFRRGRAGDERERYIGWPSWSGDTLAIVPHPWERAQSGSVPIPPTNAQAVRNLRRIFHDIARIWAGSFPRDPEAVAALAYALQLNGREDALSTLARARTFASTPDLRLRLMSDEVWLRVRLGLPDAIGQLTTAAALADSAIALAQDAQVSGQSGALVAGLAALRGRIADAEFWSRRSAPEIEGLENVPASIATDASALLALSSVEPEANRIGELEEIVHGYVEEGADQSLRDRMISTLLERPAILVFPSDTFRLHLDPPAVAGQILRAQAAAAALRRDDALRLLEERVAVLTPYQPVLWASDGVLPLARLYQDLGHPDRAHDLVLRYLEALRWSEPGALESVARAGALMRLIALAAETAEPGSNERWHRSLRALRR